MMKKNRTLAQLHDIHRKMQNGAFLTEVESELFGSLVISSYASAPVAQIVLSSAQDTLVLQTHLLLDQVELATLRHPKQNTPYWMIQPYRLNHLPEEDCSKGQLRLMLSPHALLPKELTPFQKKQLSQLEVLLGYTAVHIVRNRYRKEFCELPKIDNRLKSFFYAWADRWYKILNLCSICMDFLSEYERKKFLKSWIWLDALIQEHRQHTLVGLMLRRSPLTPKYQQAEYWEEYATDIENRRIPSDVDSKETPNLFRLLEIATYVAGDSLREYVASIRHYARELKKPNPMVVAIGFDSTDGSVTREQRGRGG